MPAEKYRIFIDATADFPAALRDRVGLLPMQIAFGGQVMDYAADWDERKMGAFYARLKAGELPATSQISPFTYEQAFEQVLSSGEDILYLCFSSGLSNSFASAQVAINALARKVPQRKVVLFDTRSATYAQGMLLEKALKNLDAGVSIDDNLADLQRERAKIACWFTVSDLMYLRHGGRISAAAALIGTTLRIMPILCIDEAGRLPVVDKVQGRKTAIRALVRRFQATADRPGEQVVTIIHCAAEEEARLLESMVRGAVPQVGGTHIGGLGPVIGAHTGPGTLALVFRTKGSDMARQG